MRYTTTTVLPDTAERAQKIIELVAKKSFGLFKKRAFRKPLNWDSLSPEEQDRIFNEIVISGVTLAALMTESIANESKNKNSEQYLRELSMEIRSAYGNYILSLGAPKKYADMFKTVIDMRAKEYRKDYLADKKGLMLKNKRESSAWHMIVAIGGYYHIVRGDEKMADDARHFKLFRDFIYHLTHSIISAISP